MDGQEAILACIGSRAKRRFGYASFIEWHKTSFYIKSQYEPLQTTKVSIHGPDPRPEHVGKQHFRLDLERNPVLKSALTAGGGWGSDPGFEPPLVFSGRRVHDKACHIVRFSADWSMFVKGIPSAPTPQLDPRATLNAIALLPPPGRVTHIDVYLSNDAPYWPNEDKARARNAGMGPIVNDADMYLTSVVSQEPVTFEPDPFGDLTGDAPLKDCVRGVAAGVDTTGLLWLTDKMLPRQRLSTAQPRRRRGRR
jgi:hypothetical protein